MTSLERVRQVGEQDRVGERARARRCSPARRPRARALAAAAASTVVPQRPAWIRSTASSGCHSSRNASLNVPRAPSRATASPHGTLEQVQPVQQPAALAVVGVAQVERELLRAAPRASSRSRRCSRATSCCERHHRRRRPGTSPSRSPTTQLARGPARAARRSRGRARRAWRRAARRGPASGRSRIAGERARQPRRVDDLRRGRVEPLLAQQPRGARQPARDGVLGVVEELVVPGRRVDAGAVAAVARQQPVGPRHPGRRDLHLRAGPAACAGRAPPGRARRARARARRRTRPRRSPRRALAAARIAWRM